MFSGWGGLTVVKVTFGSRWVFLIQVFTYMLTYEWSYKIEWMVGTNIKCFLLPCFPLHTIITGITLRTLFLVSNNQNQKRWRRTYFLMCVCVALISQPILVSFRDSQFPLLFQNVQDIMENYQFSVITHTICFVFIGQIVVWPHWPYSFDDILNKINILL